VVLGLLKLLLINNDGDVEGCIAMLDYFLVIRQTLWVNGEKRGTDITSYTLPSVDFTKLAFDSGAGVSPFYGKAKQVQLYKTYLSNDEMAALTTL
jgi:hypothetical protein